jgi:hypothetical protein
VILEKLKDRQNNIVHVAETTRFCLLRVVQPSCPIDADVGESMVQLDRPV